MTSNISTIFHQSEIRSLGSGQKPGPWFPVIDEKGGKEMTSQNNDSEINQENDKESDPCYGCYPGECIGYNPCDGCTGGRF